MFCLMMENGQGLMLGVECGGSTVFRRQDGKRRLIIESVTEMRIQRHEMNIKSAYPSLS